MGDSLTVKPIHGENKSYRHLYIHLQKTFWLCKSVYSEQELRKGCKCFGVSPGAQSICLTFILIFILHSCINCLFCTTASNRKSKYLLDQKLNYFYCLNQFSHTRELIISGLSVLMLALALSLEDIALEKYLQNYVTFFAFFFSGTVMYHLAKHWQFLLIYLSFLRTVSPYLDREVSHSYYVTYLQQILPSKTQTLCNLCMTASF